MKDNNSNKDCTLKAYIIVYGLAIILSALVALI